MPDRAQALLPGMRAMPDVQRGNAHAATLAEAYEAVGLRARVSPSVTLASSSRKLVMVPVVTNGV